MKHALDNKKSIDMGGKDLDIFVDGQLVLHIGQVSDKDTIDLFLYPKGHICESLIHQAHPDDECTHEILCERAKERKKKRKNSIPADKLEEFNRRNSTFQDWQERL